MANTTSYLQKPSHKATIDPPSISNTFFEPTPNNLRPNWEALGGWTGTNTCHSKFQYNLQTQVATKQSTMKGKMEGFVKQPLGVAPSSP